MESQAMNEDDVTAQNLASYTPPRLLELGSVQEITLGVPSAAPDIDDLGDMS
ncbi:MAG: lasso RiPP family leader peptide-containing protein [Polyangiaceae bacterium]|nr:lasso RiPP family leader peptide-containing protein [Polyangiaceae bacterium]